MPRITRHPGVRLFSRRRASTTTHYARWNDPLTGAPRDTNLTTLGLSNAVQRKRWAERKSERLAELRASLSGGGRPVLVELSRAAADYLADAGARLRPHTVRSYREAVLAFTAWAAEQRLEHVQEVDGAVLFRYRAVLAADPSKGARTANSHMLRLKAALNWWRRAGLVPQLGAEAISDSLGALKATRPEPSPLQREHLVELLAAADDVDILVVAFYLLTGLRASEGLRLPWGAVRGDELHVSAGDSKTGHARIVELDVCPSLLVVLERLHAKRTGDLVLDGWTEHTLRGLRRRLRDASAPDFTFQRLRQTCGSYLTNAPGIYGGASAYHSARRLGHSVEVAEQFYLGRVRVPRDASLLEEAMGIVDVLRDRGLWPVDGRAGAA